MSRLSWYIFGELMKVFLVAMTGMTVVMLLAGVAQEAFRQGLGWKTISQLIPFLLPNALRFSAPGAILLATCSVYGRMSADHEITAVKSVGVSPLVVVRPALVLAFLLSLGTVWLNDLAVSWGEEGIHRVIMYSVEEIAYGMLRTNRSYATKEFSITVAEIRGRKLISPTIVLAGNANESVKTITASEAEISCSADDNTLRFTMWNGAADLNESSSFVFRDRFEQAVPLPQVSKHGNVDGGASHLSLREIGGELEKQTLARDSRVGKWKAQTAAGLCLASFHSIAGPTSTGARQNVETLKRRVFRLRTEPWRRWATGFSCFFFVLVGAPLAIRMRTADLWTSFGLCFMPILVLYYPLIAIAVDRSKAGQWPAFSVWLGNAVLMVVGLWLLRGVSK